MEDTSGLSLQIIFKGDLPPIDGQGGKFVRKLVQGRIHRFSTQFFVQPI